MLLRKLLRKISVERTRDENHQIYSALKKLLSTTGLLADCEPEVLKGLCAVAQLDVWDEPGVAIDADSGFFMILSGAVKTSTLSLSESLAQHRRRAEQFSALLHDGFTLSTLVAGNSFGAVGEMGSINRRIRSAFTIEPCEILRITSSDHQRVMQKIQYKHEMEKLNILEGCKLLSDWSKQPLNSVAKLIKWSKFPSGVVVAKQGEMAKFLSIIKSGECRVLTHIVIPVTLPNCPQAKHRRMVEICRIGPFEMFGEASVLFSIPMTYTVVTSSAVELATLDSASISDLDQFTFQLFKQSSEKTSRQISQTEVEEEFARQQMKRSWEQLKLSVLSDSLRYCGIQPGVGKWKK
jgi:CRP-like cAMP-binding protein